ncbi:hypothetical protein C4573_03245 [Candidatus Woesearchaeota archaeon]|nr:MAG: hypothetical protein C4573_03245 [Candidatus Woesearchaeota archaeon]
MLIHALTLEHIRSYIQETVQFPLNATLLLGDIGSGKTTILLAIEFAIFGTRRTELSADSLLRHGTNQGSVELTFSLGANNITIKRFLKRQKKGIAQESGYIVINDVKTEGTALELKSKILSLLGYPDELLTKSKSLMYRYTVYTPQEEMKSILFENSDERLNTLRIIFNIDKYKRIKENSQIFLKEIKTKRKVMEARIEDLELLKKNMQEKKQELAVLQEQIASQKPMLVHYQKKLKEKEQLKETLEKQIQGYAALKQQIIVAETKIKHHEQQQQKNSIALKQLLEELENLEEKLKQKLPDINHVEARQKNELLLKQLEAQKEEVHSTLIHLKTLSQQAEQIIKKISVLDTCPLCMQTVSEEHKHSITAQQQDIITNQKKILLDAEAQLRTLAVQVDEQKRKKELIIKLEFKLKEKEYLQKQVEEKTKTVALLEKESQQLSGENMLLKKHIEEIKLLIKEEQQEELKKLLQEIENIRQEQKKFEIALASLEKELRMKEMTVAELQRSLEEKEKQKEKLQRLQEWQHWIETFFAPLIDTMEKHVFVKIHGEFSDTFKEWFGMMMEEALSVRLDENFTPIIEQNGYETTVENLSGGEKTAVALAYRLSLNRVINDYVSTIQTKDLIILDEPTDGFSSEQLDKMRDILQKLNTQQTIIVSHEPKMESYVQHIIRVMKTEHVSRVLA